MTRPRIGDRAQRIHYGGQDWLYHWTTCDRWRQVRKNGFLRPGRGESGWSPATRRALEEQPRLFLSAQRDKWKSSFDPHCSVLLRVRPEDVDCRYDGGEWIYDGDEPEHEIVDGRLADCAVSGNVPLRLVEVRQADGSWESA